MNDNLVDSQVFKITFRELIIVKFVFDNPKKFRKNICLFLQNFDSRCFIVLASS